MKEIEVLIDFSDNLDKVLKILSNYQYVGCKELVDIYYVDKLRNNLKPEDDLRIKELFRIRKSGNGCYLTYKKNHFDGKRWLYSDEYETFCENFDVACKIVSMLGLEELIVVKNKRRTYKSGEYEIVLDDIKDYGLFIEVEKLTSSDVDVKKVKEEIRKFIKTLNLSDVHEFNVGKNQIMLAKKLGRKNFNLYVR